VHPVPNVVDTFSSHWNWIDFDLGCALGGGFPVRCERSGGFEVVNWHPTLCPPAKNGGAIDSENLGQFNVGANVCVNHYPELLRDVLAENPGKSAFVATEFEVVASSKVPSPGIDHGLSKLNRTPTDRLVDFPACRCTHEIL
jgi:hypothetical protein